jgi:hypothetical protein
MYQASHYESSANGITSPATWIAVFFGLIMLLALVVANSMTKIDSEKKDADSRNLPFTYFIIITCWMFLSGSWLMWNSEAREFMYRKLCRVSFIDKMWVGRPKITRNQVNRNNFTQRRRHQHQLFQEVEGYQVEQHRIALENQDTTSGGQIDENCVAIDNRQHMTDTELTAPFDLESTVSKGSSMGEYGSCSSPSDWGTPSHQRAISVNQSWNMVDLPGWIMDDDLERTESQN